MASVARETTHVIVPLQPSVHADAFFTAIAPHPEAFTYIPFDPFPTVDAFNEWVELRIRRDPALVLFAMIDKTNPVAHEADALAGIIGLMNTEADNLATEIGLLFTLPRAQRTHVTRNAVGLLVRWCFDELRVRRLQWRTDPRNVASIRTAERMGFRREMVRRWERVLPPGNATGLAVRADDLLPEYKGLETMYLSICWDDWPEWKAKVQTAMDR